MNNNFITKNKSQKKVKKKVEKDIDKKNNSDYKLTTQYICTHNKKFIIIDIFFIIIIFFYLYRIFYLPDKFTNQFIKEMYHQFNRYIKKKENLVTLIIFLILIGLFMSISLHEFQSLSIVLFVTFITSIFQKGEAFILSASIAGIFIYFIYRIKILLYNKKHKIDCKKILKKDIR